MYYTPQTKTVYYHPRLGKMAKVLFLLCVPEEEGETENAKNVKKGNAKDAENEKSTITLAVITADNTADSSVDSEKRKCMCPV